LKRGYLGIIWCVGLDGPLRLSSSCSVVPALPLTLLTAVDSKRWVAMYGGYHGCARSLGLRWSSLVCIVGWYVGSICCH